jgi:hypothetical protein
VGNGGALKQKQVRAVIVEVGYPFFGGRRQHQIVLRPDTPGEEPSVQLTLPLGDFTYDYSITWQLEGGQRLTTKGRDSSGIVFVDEIPGWKPGTGEK